MRRLFTYLTTIFIALIMIAGCQQADNTSETNETATLSKLQVDQTKPYIGFAMDTLQDERWYRDKDYFETALHDLGANVKTLAANGVQEVQNQQVKLMIEEGIDVLVIIPADAEGAKDAVALAEAADIPVISYDKMVMNAAIDYYISFDNIKVGELQATAILNEVPEGNIAYVGGAPSDNNAHLFREGAMNVLQPKIDDGSINLVYDNFTEGWSPEVARDNFQSFLNDATVDAVIAANDGTAGGVIEALGDRRVPISGQDAELAAIQRIIDGTQTMTVYKSLENIANTAATSAYELAIGNTIETNQTVNNNLTDVPSILLDPVSVDVSNIDETVIQEGHIDPSDLAN